MLDTANLGFPWGKQEHMFTHHERAYATRGPQGHEMR